MAKGRISWGQDFERDIPPPPKSNIDTKNDGFLKCTPCKHGYLEMNQHVFGGVILYFFLQEMNQKTSEKMSLKKKAKWMESGWQVFFWQLWRPNSFVAVSFLGTKIFPNNRAP